MQSAENGGKLSYSTSLRDDSDIMSHTHKLCASEGAPMLSLVTLSLQQSFLACCLLHDVLFRRGLCQLAFSPVPTYMLPLSYCTPVSKKPLWGGG